MSMQETLELPECDATLLLEARVDNLDEAIDFVQGELDRRECPPKVGFQVAICLEELFVNVAHYAYGEDNAGGPVTIGYAFLPADKGLSDGAGIRVELADAGVPFDPLARPDVERPQSAMDMEIGGLGIFMTKNIADALSYEYRDGHNVTSFELRW